MNIPSIYRKALEGFIIPPRTWFQMGISAARGAWSLLDEKSRKEFMTLLQTENNNNNSNNKNNTSSSMMVINEPVLSQAHSGPLLLLSLFHDLQNPLFRRYNFDAAQFLQGVGPALEQFHNVSGALENRLHEIHQQAVQQQQQQQPKEQLQQQEKEPKEEQGSTMKSTSNNDDKKTPEPNVTAATHNENDNGTENNSDATVRRKTEHESNSSTMSSKESQPSPPRQERPTLGLDSGGGSSNPFFSLERITEDGNGDAGLEAVLEHDWAQEAEKNPDSSLEGQLSRMMTPELFQIHQISAKTAFLFQSSSPLGQRVRFKEGSCSVENVALLSARAFACVQNQDEQEQDKSDKNHNPDPPQEQPQEPPWGESTGWKYEILDHQDVDEAELKRRKGGVAAQIEILYDVVQEFESSNEDDDDDKANPSSATSTKTTTDISSTSSSSANDPKSNASGNQMETRILSVAVMEGWLHGGPEDQLRWRLALYRPAFEFPGMQ